MVYSNFCLRVTVIYIFTQKCFGLYIHGNAILSCCVLHIDFRRTESVTLSVSRLFSPPLDGTNAAVHAQAKADAVFSAGFQVQI